MASSDTALPLAARERASIAAPFGMLILEAQGGKLAQIELQAEAGEPVAPATPLLQEAARQFDAYFQDPRWRFSLPAPPAGTPYQQKVWAALAAIAPGSAQSYAHIAAALRSGPRAVAAACRANRLPILIPCHRAVAARGLGGFCGAVDGPFLDIKRWLLQHEAHALR